MIFVTGATEHVGSHVVQLLRSRGKKIRVNYLPDLLGRQASTLAQFMAREHRHRT